MLSLRDRFRSAMKNLPNDIYKEVLLDDLENQVKEWLYDGAKLLHGKD